MRLLFVAGCLVVAAPLCAANKSAGDREGVLFSADKQDYQNYTSLLTSFAWSKSGRIRDLEILGALSLFDALDFIKRSGAALQPLEERGFKKYMELSTPLMVNVPAKVASANRYVHDILDYFKDMATVQEGLDFFNERYVPIYDAITKKYKARTELPPFVSLKVLSGRGSIAG